MERAKSDPAAVLAEVDRELDASSGRVRVELLRAAGVAHRELQQLDRSAASLERAAAEATAIGDQRLRALVQVSLAATVLYRGDATAATTIIEAAIEDLTGVDRFVALAQRAGILHRAGRVADALGAFAAAFADPFAAAPSSALAEAHNNRGVLLGYSGEFAAAERDILAAHDIYVQLGQHKSAADMDHNRAWVAGRRGDLARSLELFDAARAEYERLHVPADAVLPDRCEVLVEAGLLDEAAELAEAAGIAFAARGDLADQAESLVLVAQIALMQRRWVRAGDAAAQAEEMFLASGRSGWTEHAAALRLDASLLGGDNAEVPPERLAALRAGLEHSGLHGARADFDLLRARLRLARGDVPGAGAILRDVHVPSLPNHAKPAARALRAEVLVAAGDLVGARRELRRGLEELDVARASFGSGELRASIGFHGDDVIAVGQRLALASGRASAVLAWCEQGRARSLRFRSVAAAADEVTDDELRDLRDLEARATNMAASDPERPATRVAIDGLRRRVRDRSRHRVGARMLDAPRVSLSSIRSALGPGGRLVQFVADGDVLRVVRVTESKASVIEVGSVARVEQAALVLRESLGRVVVGRGNERMRASALEMLQHDVKVFDALLGGVGHLVTGSAPAAARHVVLVPTPELVAVPWGLLAALVDVPFVVAPSVGSWLASRRAQRDAADVGSGRALAVGGARLALAATEASGVAALRDRSTLLLGEAATAAEVRALLGEATVDVAHIVCHGRFVADNPLLSSLEMADGPLFLFELERLGHLPALMVLSACHSAIAAPRPGEELIGFVSTLLGAGSASVVATCVPIPDTADTAAAMIELHHALLAGATPAQALTAMRRRNPLLGAALNVFGA